MENHNRFRHILLMTIACLVPIFILFFLASLGYTISPILFFLFFILGCFLMFYAMGTSHKLTSGTETNEKNNNIAEDNYQPVEVPEYFNELFETNQAYKLENNLVFEGKFLSDPDEAYNKLTSRLKDSSTQVAFQEDDAGRNFIIINENKSSANVEKKEKKWLNGLLFILTVLTTTWAGAAHHGVNLLNEPDKFSIGLPYAIALMLILGVHELGHYFTARRHNMKVTLPFFIPVPFALGTFGAFIQMKSIAHNRKALFDVGIAGPLAGLVIAIPALIIGIQSSQIVPVNNANSMMNGTDIGSSILLALLAKLSLGQELIIGHTLQLSPLAFAGWLGLLVTALNLLPIGQLDGGHIAHALFGRKNANTIGTVALFSLFLLGLFVWSGLLTWAIIVFFLAGVKSAPPLNDITKLDGKRVALGLIAFIILFLILIPVPHSFYESLGINCPYV